jgi:hypothetical protein
MELRILGRKRKQPNGRERNDKFRRKSQLGRKFDTP